jgi:enoyl-CoA hydratase/carnithine racemase
MQNKVWKRTEMYRTYLEDYAEKWKEFFLFKRVDGILEVRMHFQGKEPRWDMETHRAFIPAFADIHHDPENECLIFTGTGNEFLAEFDAEGLKRAGLAGDPFGYEQGYKIFFQDQTKEPFALLNLDIPVVCAINGPLFMHGELALLNDIVICSENTTIQDVHFPKAGVTPGDGVHTLFRELLGHVRGKYFLYTGQMLDAQESLRLGLVSEVLPQDKLMDRAWELARKIMTRSPIHRRMTRTIFIQPWRELFTKELAFGQGLESWACQIYWPLAEGAADPNELKAGKID